MHSKGPCKPLSGLLKEDNALPLHGLLTAIWINFTGNSEFAARYLSVLLGTVTTPLVIRLSSALARIKYSGLGSGLAYATFPIFVFYTQEVRMYALAIPLAATFSWLTIRLYRQGKNPLLYTLIGILMLASHLYTGLIWAVCLVWGMIGIGVQIRYHIGTNNNPTRWFRANVYYATWIFTNRFLGGVASEY